MSAADSRPATAPDAGPSRTGRVLHAGQAVVDVVLRIPAVPEAGGDVFASSHELVAGGGVNTMTAAARDGAEVIHLGSHGSGPFGDVVRGALAAEGVTVLAEPDPGRDTGFSVALVDDTAERTFVSTSGAEAHAPLPQLLAAAPVPGDIVCVSGYSLVHPVNRTALLQWLPTVGEEIRVVVDPSPMIGEVDLEAVRTLLVRADVWSTNEREARLLTARLADDEDGPSPAVADIDGEGEDDGDGDGDGDIEHLAARLCSQTGRVIILRTGARGSVIARPTEQVHSIPAPRVNAVDTNGAGDAHTGVLCARLAAGDSLEDSVHRAGVAAAIAVTRPGPATAPTAAETDHMIDTLFSPQQL